jgi:hypothetical protein
MMMRMQPQQGPEGGDSFKIMRASEAGYSWVRVLFVVAGVAGFRGAYSARS